MICKRKQHVCILQSCKVQVYPQDVINLIIQKLNPLHLCMCNEQWIDTPGSYEISTPSVFLNLI